MDKLERLKALSDIELKIFSMECRGMTLQEISEELSMEDYDVLFHMSSVSTKLGSRYFLQEAYCPLLEESIQEV